MKKTLSICSQLCCASAAACGPQTPTDKPVVTTAHSVHNRSATNNRKT